MGTTNNGPHQEGDRTQGQPGARLGAIANAEKFGEWFKVDLSGETFRAGQPAHSKMTYPGHQGHPFEIFVDRIEPQRLFSFKWHPYGIDQNYDCSRELIEFILEDVDGGTKLTITESGFDEIPLARRAEAFRANSQGWGIQIHNIEAYVTGGS